MNEEIDLADDVLGARNSGPETAPACKIPRSSKTRPFSNIIHRWFSDVGGGDSKCLVCSKVIKGKNGTNLETHLRSKHSEEHEKFQAEKKELPTEPQRATSAEKRKNQISQTIDHCFRQMLEGKDGLKKGSVAYENAIRSIAMGFAANSLPFRLIEDPFIKHMLAVSSDGRLINLPNRHELSMKIADISNELKSSIMAALVNVSNIAITTDLWSKPGYSSAMMGITCHYFNQQLNCPKRVLLACRTIKQPHTAENIFRLYSSIMEEWKIDESRVLRIVTDNGSNVVCAFKECLVTLLQEKTSVTSAASATTSLIDPNLDESMVDDESSLDPEEAEFDENENELDIYFYRVKRLSCFAHTLMLAVKSAVDCSIALKNAKVKAHSMIAAVSKSAKATELLKEKINGLGLIKPVVTRWIYWYYVFDRLILIRRSLTEVCEDLDIIHDLGPAEWKLLESVRDLLAPFVAAVKRLEGESYATISEVYPILFSLRDHLRESQHVPTPIVRVIRKLSNEIDTRFAPVLQPSNIHFDPIYVLATFLDPRYSLLVEGELLEIGKHELKSMIAADDAQVPFSQNHQSSASISINNQPQSADTKSAATFDIFAAACAKISEKRCLEASTSSVSSVEQELAVYMNELMNLGESAAQSDPFSFWVKKSTGCPQVHRIAVDILSIPATSAPSERVFSRAGFVLGRNRHNMSDEKLEQEVFYKMNAEFLVHQ